jgi:hypothetical protein
VELGPLFTVLPSLPPPANLANGYRSNGIPYN